MARIGVMQQIRERLRAGESARNIINAGFRPGTVFKTQWQIRRDRRDGQPDKDRMVASPARIDHWYFNPKLAGSLSLFVDEDDPDEVLALMEFDPPAACPGCGADVFLWRFDLDSAWLSPRDCDCPEDSPDAANSYSFEEILSATPGPYH